MVPAGLAFVTSSPHKHREAEAILALRLDRAVLDLPEPQGLDVVVIARDKARAAYGLLGRPVLVEDTSLELQALGGFPGPLVRWLLEAAGPAAIPRMLDGLHDRSARARCAAVVFDGTREWFGVGEVAGAIVSEPRGQGGFGWDVVFAPDWAGGRTYAELPPDEKNARSHRRLALEALRRQLTVGCTS
ncbi:MAG: non-canonical purine NTP pyrophosphatase [Thermoanaerobaculaceae bacterium]|jgi:non-canonical purine NTP pyrophosphatase (RdgB/HAM1 family)